MACVLLAACGSSSKPGTATRPTTTVRPSTTKSTRSTTTTTAPAAKKKGDPAWACATRRDLDLTGPGAPKLQAVPMEQLLTAKVGQRFVVLGENRFAAVVGVVDDQGHLLQRATALPDGSRWRLVQDTYCVPAGSAAPPTTSAPAAGGAGASTTTTAPPPSGSAAEPLSSLILAAVPGFTLQADSVGDTGPSDLEKAINDDGADDARQELTGDGFVAGCQRLFEDKAGNQVIVFVYRFSNPAGAQHYDLHGRQQIANDTEAPTLTEFAVPGVPGAHAVWGVQAGSTSRVVDFAAGNYAVLVLVNGKNATVPGTDTVASLAKQQYDRLL